MAEPTTGEIALRIGVIELLRSPGVQSINFMFEGVVVNGDLFTEVAARLELWHTIRRGGRHVRVGSGHYPIRMLIAPRRLNRHSEAEYWPASNRLVFRHVNLLATLAGRIVVLHECMHAGKDALRTRHLAYREEAAAFLLERLYLLNVGHYVEPAGSIEEAAYALAMQMHSANSTTVSGADAQPLLTAVGRLYRRDFHTTHSDRYAGDGVRI